MNINKQLFLLCFGLVYLCYIQPMTVYGQEVNHIHIDSVLTAIKTLNVKEKGGVYNKLGFLIIRNHSPAEATPLLRYALENDTIRLAKLWLYDPFSKNLSHKLLQEEIYNIRKQAEATSILIQFFEHGTKLNLMEEDNGKGFNYKEEPAKGGLGLKRMNSRVQFFNGTIDWDSQFRNTSNINITIPLA